MATGGGGCHHRRRRCGIELDSCYDVTVMQHSKDLAQHVIYMADGPFVYSGVVYVDG